MLDPLAVRLEELLVVIVPVTIFPPWLRSCFPLSRSPAEPGLVRVGRGAFVPVMIWPL